jgi:hypothetical protein
MGEEGGVEEGGRGRKKEYQGREERAKGREGGGYTPF